MFILNLLVVKICNFFNSQFSIIVFDGRDPRSVSPSLNSQTLCPLSTALNHTRVMAIESRGCIASHLCNHTESGNVLTLGYTMTKTCCNKDLCNGAASVQLPLAAALGGALVAIWTTWSLWGREEMFDCVMLFFFWFQLAFMLLDVLCEWWISSTSDSPHSLGGKYRVRRRRHPSWAGTYHSFVLIGQDLHLFSFLFFLIVPCRHTNKSVLWTPENPRVTSFICFGLIYPRQGLYSV